VQRYPLTLGTISGILNALAQEHRISLEFGHRSLDNRHLITKVTVLAEPLAGVTLAPPETPQPRGPNQLSSDALLLDPALLVRMVRQLVQKRLRDELVPVDTLQQLAAHVEHLVSELELYEQLVQEADEELMAKQAEWEAHERDWVQLIETVEAEAADKVNRAERTAEQMRTRSNQHFARIQVLTQQLQQVQESEHAAQAELAEYHQRVSDLSKQLEQAGRDLQESHHRILEAQVHAESARDHYYRVIQTAKLREQHLVTETMRWAQLTSNIIMIVGRLHPNETLINSKMAEFLLQNPPDTWAQFLMTMSKWVREADAAGEPLMLVEDRGGRLQEVNIRSYEEAAAEVRPGSMLHTQRWLDQAVAPLDADPAGMGWTAPEDTKVRDAARAADLDRQLRHMYRVARSRERLLINNAAEALLVIQSLLVIIRELELNPNRAPVLDPEIYENLGVSQAASDHLVSIAQWTMRVPWRLLRIMTTRPEWIKLVNIYNDHVGVSTEWPSKAIQELMRQITRADFDGLLDQQVGPLRLPNPD
jgi:hypothetical protein